MAIFNTDLSNAKLEQVAHTQSSLRHHPETSPYAGQELYAATSHDKIIFTTADEARAELIKYAAESKADIKAFFAKINVGTMSKMGVARVHQMIRYQINNIRWYRNMYKDAARLQSNAEHILGELVGDNYIAANGLDI